jgi:hypothetical protein
VDANAILVAGSEQCGFARTGQDVNLVTELGERTRMVPGVRADPAKPRFWRVLEREERNLQVRAAVSVGLRTRSEPERVWTVLMKFLMSSQRRLAIGSTPSNSCALKDGNFRSIGGAGLTGGLNR